MDLSLRGHSPGHRVLRLYEVGDLFIRIFYDRDRGCTRRERGEGSYGLLLKLLQVFFDIHISLRRTPVLIKALIVPSPHPSSNAFLHHLMVLSSQAFRICNGLIEVITTRLITLSHGDGNHMIDHTFSWSEKYRAIRIANGYQPSTNNYGNTGWGTHDNSI